MIIQEILTAPSNDPREELDAILAKCCEAVLDGQASDSEFYGMVGACVVCPDGQLVYGVNYQAEDGRRVHAERAALERCDNVTPDCIIVTTLSPCNRPMDERSGESCEDLIAEYGIEHVYSGYKDPTQEGDDSIETKNSKLRELCKRLADTFLDEARKKKRKSRGGGYFFPGYSYYGGGVGSSEGGGGESKSGMAEGSESYPEVLYHGSTQEIEGPLTPRQAGDIGGAKKSNKNAIYATDDPNFAIAYSLAERGSDTGTFGWKKDPHLIFFGGKIRHGQNVYIHILPTRDEQGRPLFVRGAADAEWYSRPGVKEVTPTEVKPLPVDQYLHLLRKPTPEEQKIFQANKAKAKQGVAEGYLNEASSDEAWELVGQPVPEIQQFVKQMGYGNNEQSVAKITSIIDKVQPTQITAASIPKLKNLANKGNDVQTLKAIQQISGRPDAAQQYARLMQARDAGEGRNRGYPVGDLIQAVKSGNYDPPVLLKLPTGIYVIGGRTRLYAALALGVPANVKIISANNFKQDMAENFADGKVKGKSRPGRVKRAGASCNGSVTDLRARAKRASGEKAKMYHWCANMKSGRKKK